MNQPERAAFRLRAEIAQLAVAAADSACRTRQDLRGAAALSHFDKLAGELAQPALRHLAQLAGDPSLAQWPAPALVLVSSRELHELEAEAEAVEDGN
jgi:hypothetical protein